MLVCREGTAQTGGGRSTVREAVDVALAVEGVQEEQQGDGPLGTQQVGPHLQAVG